MSTLLIVMFVAVIAIVAQPGELSAPQEPETLSPEEAGKIILKKRAP